MMRFNETQHVLFKAKTGLPDGNPVFVCSDKLIIY